MKKMRIVFSSMSDRSELCKLEIDENGDGHLSEKTLQELSTKTFCEGDVLEVEVYEEEEKEKEKTKEPITHKKAKITDLNKIKSASELKEELEKKEKADKKKKGEYNV